jgi:GNAT superfamily N-acetyltransferase
MQHLKRTNLIEIMGNMNLPGWGTLVQDDLVALVSPTQQPIANMAWGVANRTNLERCRVFFQGKPFAWLLEPGQDSALLEQNGFGASNPAPEMIHGLDYAESPAPADGVTVAPADRDSEVWSKLFGESFGMVEDEVLEFFQPVNRQKGSHALIGFFDSQPAGTALVHVGRDSAAIYAMSTLPAFRRKGVASAMVWTCLDLVRAGGCRQAALYASPMGLPMYEKHGFRTVQVLREFHSAGYPG